MERPTNSVKKRVEQTFDNIATTYDRVGTGMFGRFGARLAELPRLGPGSSVLDVATGSGAVLLPVARRVGSAGHVTGIDLSAAMLKEAEDRARSAHLNNVELRKMDAEHLEFPDQSFDAVTCGFGVFFCPDMQAALREMYRVCRTGGCLAVSVFNKTPPRGEPASGVLREQSKAYGVTGGLAPHNSDMALDQVEDLLKQAPFRSIETFSETADMVYPSPEDYWESLRGSTFSATLMSIDEEKRQRFRDEYLAKLHTMLRQDGLHLPVGVIYALAQR